MEGDKPLKSFEKKPLKVEEQISLLISLGLIISDKSKAAFYLSNISYYRLSIYMRFFKTIKLSINLNKVLLSKMFSDYIDSIGA